MGIVENSIFLTIIILLTVLLIVLIVGSFYFYNLAIKRSRKEFLVNNKDLEQIKDNNSVEEEIHISKGAGHGMAYVIDKRNYERKVTAFLSRFIDQGEL